MPYVYVGRRNFYIGKTLWEILGNLKDFGVGRIVYRNKFQRYPEPSYMKIMKVAALPAEEPYVEKGITYTDERKVIVLVEKTFRGRKISELVQEDSITYKNDYRLVPKDEEEEFCRQVDPPPERILPIYGEFAPLFKKLAIRNKKLAGEEVEEEPKLKMVYNLTGIKNYRVAKEGETPTLEVACKAQPLYPYLYEPLSK